MTHGEAPYLLAGSFAYDSILLHTGHFHARILPEALARLNVAFGVDDVAEAFGGTGGNIAYNAALLGQHPLLIGSLGTDGARYRSHLHQQGYDSSTLATIDLPTAHAWLLTDSLNNQITAFHAGAMRAAPVLPAETPYWWLLSPNHVPNMARLAQQGFDLGKAVLFDPGQALPSFLEGAADATMPLAEILKQAQGIFVNDYESALLCDQTQQPLAYWLQDPEQFIVCTRGGEGLDLITMKGTVRVPVAGASVIADPTGCGDALRAGFLYGLTAGQDLLSCAQLGAVMGSFAIEASGGQRHKPALADIQARLSESYEPKP